MVGTTNYLGNAGRSGRVGIAELDRFEGPLTNRSQTSYQQIIDGSSHTLLIGEAIGEIVNGDFVRAFSWMGSGSISPRSSFGDPTWYNFSSSHPSGVGFCLADGSVRFIPIEIDRDILYALGGIRDGEPYSQP